MPLTAKRPLTLLCTFTRRKFIQPSFRYSLFSSSHRHSDTRSRDELPASFGPVLSIHNYTVTPNLYSSLRPWPSDDIFFSLSLSAIIFCFFVVHLHALLGTETIDSSLAINVSLRYIQLARCWWSMQFRNWISRFPNIRHRHVASGSINNIFFLRPEVTCFFLHDITSGWQWDIQSGPFPVKEIKLSGPEVTCFWLKRRCQFFCSRRLFVALRAELPRATRRDELIRPWEMVASKDSSRSRSQKSPGFSKKIGTNTGATFQNIYI